MLLLLLFSPHAIDIHQFYRCIVGKSNWIYERFRLTQKVTIERKPSTPFTHLTSLYLCAFDFSLTKCIVFSSKSTKQFSSFDFDSSALGACTFTHTKDTWSWDERKKKLYIIFDQSSVRDRLWTRKSFTPLLMQLTFIYDNIKEHFAPNKRKRNYAHGNKIHSPRKIYDKKLLFQSIIV